MKIGYPCINYSIGKKTISTFRMSSYTEEKFIQCVNYNLATLVEILKFNIANNFMFFRIIKDHNIRISMHPDQFVIINAKSPDIVNNSIRELEYHIDLLDLMELDYSS